jgi:hypothetical protein
MEYLSKTIIPYSVRFGNKEADETLGDNAKTSYIVKTTSEWDSLDLLVKNIFEDKDLIFLDRGTMAHVGICLAFYMGAKYITLAGCEHKSFGDKHHFNSIKKYPIISNSWQSPPGHISWGTIVLANKLKEYGVNIRRYYNKETEYYERGYEEI